MCVCECALKHFWAQDTGRNGEIQINVKDEFIPAATTTITILDHSWINFFRLEEGTGLCCFAHNIKKYYVIVSPIHSDMRGKRMH